MPQHKSRLLFFHLIIFLLKFCVLGYALEVYFFEDLRLHLNPFLTFCFFTLGFIVFIWRIHAIDYLRPIFITAIFLTILVGYFSKNFIRKDIIWEWLNQFGWSEKVSVQIVMIVMFLFLIENFTFKYAKKLSTQAPEKIKSNDILDADL